MQPEYLTSGAIVYRAKQVTDIMEQIDFSQSIIDLHNLDLLAQLSLLLFTCFFSLKCKYHLHRKMDIFRNYYLKLLC